MINHDQSLYHHDSQTQSLYEEWVERSTWQLKYTHLDLFEHRVPEHSNALSGFTSFSLLEWHFFGGAIPFSGTSISCWLHWGSEVDHGGSMISSVRGANERGGSGGLRCHRQCLGEGRRVAGEPGPGESWRLKVHLKEFENRDQWGNSGGNWSILTSYTIFLEDEHRFTHDFGVRQVFDIFDPYPDKI